MQITRYALVVSVHVLGLWFASAQVSAQGTYVHRYEFQPDASQLSIHGGFAGFQLDYQIVGSFGLVVQTSNTGVPTFGFTQVRAHLVGDAPFDGQPLDPLLGMSNWTGTLTNSYQIDFLGEDGQGAPMQVDGILGNVILGLQGENRPPCCDFFDYRLDAVAQIISTWNSGHLTTATLDAPGGLWRNGRSTNPSPVPEPIIPTMILMAAWGASAVVRRRP